MMLKYTKNTQLIYREIRIWFNIRGARLTGIPERWVVTKDFVKHLVNCNRNMTLMCIQNKYTKTQ